MGAEDIASKAIAAIRQDCRETKTFAIVITATAQENGMMNDFCLRSIGFAEGNVDGQSALLAEALDQLAKMGANVIIMEMPSQN